MPGTGFKQTAKAWKATLIDTVEKPHALVRKQMAEGRNLTSVLSLAYEKEPNMDADQQHIVKWASGALYAGGADTVCIYMFPFDSSLPSCFGSKTSPGKPTNALWILTDGNHNTDCEHHVDLLPPHVPVPRSPNQSPGRD